MTQRIWKYELIPGRDTTLSMPRWATILSAGAQGEMLVIWAQVNPDEPYQQRHFRVFPTGATITEEDFGYGPSAFVATVQMGWMVWHVFEYYPDQRRAAQEPEAVS